MTRWSGVCLAGAEAQRLRMRRVPPLLYSVRLKLVHPRLALFAQQLAEQSPRKWGVITGARTQADVDAKYALGRTKRGPHAGEVGHPPLGDIVTHVHSLEQAPHAVRRTPEGSYSCAVDLQFVLPEGGGLAEGHIPEEKDVYLEMGLMAEQAGLVWGGRFKSIFDQAHVELPDWRRYPLDPPVLKEEHHG